MFWFSAARSGAGHHAQGPTNIFERHQLGTRLAALLSLGPCLLTVDSLGVCNPLPAFFGFWAAASAAVEGTYSFVPYRWLFTLLA